MKQINQERLVSRFLKSFQMNNFAGVIELFTYDAVITSPIYPDVIASEFFCKFYEEVDFSTFADTEIFFSKGRQDTVIVQASQELKFKDSPKLEIDSIYVFKFLNDNSFINKLDIIFDKKYILPKTAQREAELTILSERRYYGN